MEQPLKIVIASHKRADRITTHKRVKDAIICIPESQLAEYRERIGNDVEIVTHPDTVIGISAKREWMYRHFGSLFSLDDDLQFVKRVYSEPGETDKLTPAEVYAFIQANYQVAKELGVYLFCFGPSGKPFAYPAQEPIELSGYVNTCAYGILEGSKIFFRPEQRMNEDYWMSGLNAYYHRKIFKDNRIYFHFGETWTGKGGLAEFRNLDALEKDFKELQKFFGKDVITVRIKGTKNHPFQINFIAPF